MNSTTITLEEAIFALILSIVGILSVTAPFLAVIYQVKKKQEAEQGADVSWGLGSFVGLFLLTEIIVVSSLSFLYSVLNVVIKNTSIQKVYSIFWNAKTLGSEDATISNILSILVLIYRFFDLFNAFLPLLLFGLIFAMAKNSFLELKNSNESTDTIRHYVTIIMVTMIVLIMYVAWSNFSGFPLYMEHSSMYDMMQSFWRDVAGVEDASGVTKRSITPDGMSDAEALRKGLYVPKPYQDPNKVF